MMSCNLGGLDEQHASTAYLKTHLDAYNADRKIYSKDETSAGNKILEKALRSGSITLDGMDYCQVPIPSLGAYVKERLSATAA